MAATCNNVDVDNDTQWMSETQSLIYINMNECYGGWMLWWMWISDMVNDAIWWVSDMMNDVIWWVSNMMSEWYDRYWGKNLDTHYSMSEWYDECECEWVT